MMGLDIVGQKLKDYSKRLYSFRRIDKNHLRFSIDHRKYPLSGQMALLNKGDEACRTTRTF